MDATIEATGKNAGHFDIQLRAERRNKVRVILLFDIGDPWMTI